MNGEVYLIHGRVAIDDKATERDVRRTAVGKKDHLFIRHPEAGDRSEVIDTLVISARNLGADPHAYPKDIIKRLPLGEANDMEVVRALLPGRWVEVDHKLRKQTKVPLATNAAWGTSVRRSEGKQVGCLPCSTPPADC